MNNFGYRPASINFIYITEIYILVTHIQMLGISPMTHLSRNRWAYILSAIFLLLPTSLNGLRNPKGIPDSSVWNYLEIAGITIGLLIAISVPLFGESGVKKKLIFSTLAACLYVAAFVLVFVMHFFIFGLPVQS